MPRIARSILGIAAAALFAAGCSQILGLKDPSLEDKPALDAAVDAPIDMAPAVCMPAACPFGCDTSTNACREGKLWVFPTTGATVGNAFGGADMPPNPRGGADARCLATYTATFSNRPCNNNNVHAILYVSAADSLAGMSAKYGIPTNVPVHRGDDAIMIANNWVDLLDSTKPLRAPATTAATDAEGVIWTGANAVNTCVGWTSVVSTDQGTRGLTTITDTNWLSRDTFRCDRTARLLCVCWPGGN
jgi:hypothetical protein